MAFAQLTWREGLRDIATCLNAKPEALYHLGFREPVAKSTLADANEQRDWRLWEDLAKNLMRKARTLYAGEDLGLELENTVYALDSTTIDLSLTLFPWADFRRTKAGIKMHTQLDLRGPIPTCIYITNARQHDVRWLDELCFRARSFLCHGSRLHGFQALELDGWCRSLLRHAGQRQPALLPPALAASGYSLRHSQRPDWQTHFGQSAHGLSGPVAEGAITSMPRRGGTWSF